MVTAAQGLSLYYKSVSLYQASQENRACGKVSEAVMASAAQTFFLSLQTSSFQPANWQLRILVASIVYAGSRLVYALVQNSEAKDTKAPLFKRAVRFFDDHESRIMLVASLVSAAASFAFGQYAYAGAAIFTVAYKGIDHFGWVPKRVSLFVESCEPLMTAYTLFSRGGLFKVVAVLTCSGSLIKPFASTRLMEKIESVAARFFNRKHPLIHECFAKVEKKELTLSERDEIINGSNDHYELNLAHCSEVVYDELPPSNDFDLLCKIFPSDVDIERLVKILKGDQWVFGSHLQREQFSHNFQVIVPYLNALSEEDKKHYLQDLKGAGKCDYALKIHEISVSLLNKLNESYSQPKSSDGFETCLKKTLANLRKRTLKKDMKINEEMGGQKETFEGFIPLLPGSTPSFGSNYMYTFIIPHLSQNRIKFFNAYRTLLLKPFAKQGVLLPLLLRDFHDRIKHGELENITEEQAQRLMLVNFGILRKKSP